MEKLHEEYGDKLEFIGVNIGVNERFERVEKFVEKKGFKFKVVFDGEKQILKKFDVIGAPTSIIIGKDGIIKYKNMFSPKDFKEMLKEIGITDEPSADTPKE